MPTIKMDAAAHGDILDADVVVNDVVLFESGTLLTTQRLDILKSLGVRMISIVDRSERRAVSLLDLHENIDRRFSYVDALPLMAKMKAYIKDFLTNLEAGN
jgi:hypothetical protein